LAQIAPIRFTEFVKDILELIDGHTDVQVTDGSGDEKQDILSIDKNGSRHITQCKHKIDYKENHSGDEIDLLFSACFRKNCKNALYVTNTDLTIQAKRYINDNEYSRRDTKEPNTPVIDFWNGHRIWNKIKNNNQIINKWFSGLGQTHGVRNLHFKIIINQLPDKSIWNKNYTTQVMHNLSLDSNFEQIDEGDLFVGNIQDGIEINVSPDFALEDELSVRFINPYANHPGSQEALCAFKVNVRVNDQLDIFNPEEIAAQIVKYFSTNLLPEDDGEKWWHIMTTGINGLIFIYDIQKPVEVLLASGISYIKYDGNICKESDYVLLDHECNHFTRLVDDDTGLWKMDNKDYNIGIFFEQKLHPMEVFSHNQAQLKQLDTFRDLPLNAITGVDRKLMGTVRNFMHPDWLVLYSENQEYFWTYTTDTTEKKKLATEKAIRDLGLEILAVKNRDKENIFGNISTDHIPEFYITNATDFLSTPILLNERIFWFTKQIVLTKKFEPETWSKLITYKLEFESINGYDRLDLGEHVIKTSQFNSLLYDFFTLRGQQMLDIKLQGNLMTVNLRTRERRYMSSSQVIKSNVAEFERICFELESILPQNATHD